MNIITKLLILLLLLSTNIFASKIDLTKEEKKWIIAHPVLKLGILSGFEPMLIKSKDGGLNGIIPDIYNIIENRLNIKFEYITDSNMLKAIGQLKDKNIDAISEISSSLAKRKGLLQINAPFNLLTTVFAKKNNSLNIHKDTDIKNIRVAYCNEVIYLDRFLESIKDKQNLKLIKTSNPLEALKQVVDNKADIMIGLNTDSYIITKNLISEINPIFTLKDVDSTLSIGVHPENKILASILKKATDTITLQEKRNILKKWFWIQKNNKIKIDLTSQEKDYLKSKPYLSVMHQDYFQPFSSLQDDKAIGYSVDVMNLIGQSISKNIKFETNKTWTQQIEMLKNGSLDIFPYMAKNKKRHKFVQFSDKPFLNLAIGFAINKNVEISKMKDLENKRVAVVNNSFIHEHLKQNFSNIQLVLTDSVKESIKAITHNKADAALDNVTTLTHFIQDGWLNQIKITYVDDLGLPLVNKLYMGVKKENKLLISILKKARASLNQDDIISLRKKWFIEYESLISLTEEEKIYLDKKPYITAMVLENFQPFSFVKNEIALGYSVETMQLIAKQVGKEVKFINKPWGELLEMLKYGTLDVIPHIAVTDERKTFVDYTDFSHLTFLIGFAINKNHNINSIKDLKDKKIAVVNKYYIHDYLKKAFPNIELLVLNSTQEAVEAVAQNKAFAVIDNIPTLNYFIQEKWLSNLKIATVDDFGLPLETKMPMGVTKGNKLLKSILEKANSAIAHNQVTKLKQKWLNVLPTKTITNNLNVKELLYLKNKKIIKMCVLPNWLPFEQIDEDGKHKGIGADFMKIISKYIDTPVELVVTKEWAQSLQNIRDRKCDILPVAMDLPSRRDSMNFTKPYVAEPFVIATKADELFIKDSKSIREKKIGIVKSYAFIEVLKQKNPSIDVVNVTNTKEGLERVSSGELYGYIDTMPTIGYGIQKYSMLDLKIAGKLEFDITLSIASRNDEPILNTIMQKALNSISEEERRTIVGKWIEIKVAQEFDYKLLWQISAIFLIIVLAFLYKNRAVTIVNKKLVMAKHKIEEQQNMVDKYVLMLTTDTKGVITDANEAFCKVSGYTKDDLIGNTHSIMQHPDMTKEYFDKLWNTIEANKTWIDEITNYTKEKNTIYYNTYIEPIFNNNIKIGYRAIYEDITDKKRVEELSVTDKLTGLYNRLKLDEILLLEIEKFKRYKTKFSIIILDIDDFKSVNDLYGHDVGDSVLQKISQVLRDTIRITDVVGRWGGEEFVVICENTDLKNAYTAAQHIRKSIENTTHDKVGEKSVSIGVAEFKSDDTLSSIFKKADEALYEAKHSGKNRVVKYSSN